MNQNYFTPSSSSYKTTQDNSSTKRLNTVRLSNFSFEHFDLKDLTQEILEAENEPISRLPLSDDDEENEEPNKSGVKERTPAKQNNSIDLGVSCFQTPVKTNNIFKIPQIATKIFSSTPQACKQDFTIPKVTVTPSTEQFTVNNRNYRVLKELGKGGSAIVYHCLNVKSNCETAIKVINLNTDLNTIMGYRNEVKLLQQLQNCNRIIKMFDYEYLESEKKLMVVLEKGGSDLARTLRNLTANNKRIPTHLIAFYWMEMLYAVQEIHKNGIIHADLKPANFLHVQCGLKLIDFGIASRVQDDETSIARNCPIGSFNYISPEALTNQSSRDTESPSYGKPKYKIKYKSDVWSLGCILYQLIYGKTPFGYIQHVWAKLSVIMDPQHKIEYPACDLVPTKFICTIKKCLQYNIKDRPTVNDLIREYESVYF